MVRVGEGIAHGTFGEILQGALPGNNNNYLVSYPINAYSKAIYSPSVHSSQVTVIPSHKIKSQMLAMKILEYFDIDYGGILVIESELEEGKGLASSTADLLSSARALCSAFNKKIPITILLSFFRIIEPSDGIIYNEYIAFYHRRSVVCKKLGNLRKTVVVSMDEGGTIDTISFNNCGWSFSEREKQIYQNLLDKLEFACINNDLSAVGAIATKSAFLNQKINPKKNLDEVHAICNDVKALGVLVTHSGPCLGILLDPQVPFFIRQKNDVIKSFKQLAFQAKIYHSIDFNQNAGLLKQNKLEEDYLRV